MTVINGQRNSRSQQDLKVSNIEQFHLKVAPRASFEKGKIQINTHVLIPSYALQFIKEKGGFESNFEARISLLDQNGHQIENKNISQTLTADDYLETINKSNWYFIEHDFLVKPGKYTIVSEVMDIDTRNRGVKERKIDLSKYNGNFLLFPPQVMTQYQGTWQGGNKMMPSYRNEITIQQSFVPIYISGNVLSKNFTLRVLLKSMDGITISALDSTFINSSEFFTKQLELPINDIKGLRVKLVIDLIQEEQSAQEIVELKIKRPGISSSIRDVEEAMDQMRYILTNEERTNLAKAKKKEKEQLFYSFWKERDPTPETSTNELMDQYYTRVRYANEHFTSFTPGWRTDMGMIYILFAAPDDIERIFMDSNRNAHQTWHYYRINRSFTFYDENGFGDYRLTTPFIYGRAW